MSADNGIYIGHFSDGEIRVIHAQAIENLWYPANSENAEEIVRYFKDAKPLTETESIRRAFQLKQSVREGSLVLEYVISTLQFSNTFKEYEQEAERLKIFDIRQ